MRFGISYVICQVAATVPWGFLAPEGYGWHGVAVQAVGLAGMLLIGESKIRAQRAALAKATGNDE